MSCSLTYFGSTVFVNQSTMNFENAFLDALRHVPSPGAYSQNSADSHESGISMSSPGSSQSQTVTFHNMLPAEIHNILPAEIHTPPQTTGPMLTVREQPVDKFRFRYKSEMMGTHGSLLGINSDKFRKRTYPTVELLNYTGPAIIRCSLFTTQHDECARTPHTHRLVVRHETQDKDDPHDIPVSMETGYIAVFQGMGVIHTAKRHIVEELIKKKRRRRIDALHIVNNQLPLKEELKIKAEAENEGKRMNLNCVSLCFEAFHKDANGFLVPLCSPVFSSTINNMKSALTGELKICRIDRNISSSMGGEEIFVLVEKVGKKNIKVKFYELDDEENEVWCDYGKFTELDVHHQYAIVFRTPAYRNTEIEKPVDVYLQLYRPTDGDCSDPIRFTYKPSEKTLATRCKRKRPHPDDNISFEQPLQSVPAVNSLEDSALFNKILHEPNENEIHSAEFREFLQHLSFPDYLDTFSAPEMLATDGVASAPPKRITEEVSAKTVPEKKPESCEAAKIRTPKPVNGIHEEDIVKCGISILDGEEKRGRVLTGTCMRELFRLPDGKDANVLHVAINGGMMDEVKKFCKALSRSDCIDIVNARTTANKTALHLAALKNQPEVISQLLSAGADPNLQDSSLDTPLHVSVSYLHNGCVSKLLDTSNYSLSYNHKINLNLENGKGLSPLHVAAFAKNFEAVKMLVKAGADVNATESSYGRTVLHIAVEMSSIPITQFLVKNTNIEINKGNKDGYTALHLACVVGGQGNIQLCKILLKYKADPYKPNHNTGKSNSEKLPQDEASDRLLDLSIMDSPEWDTMTMKEECLDETEEIKVELEGEDEYGLESYPCQGQTSIDLAAGSNQQILELLKQAPCPEANTIDIKEEELEEPEVIEELVELVEQEEIELVGQEEIGELVELVEVVEPEQLVELKETEDSAETVGPTIPVEKDSGHEKNSAHLGVPLFDKSTLLHICKLLDKSGNWEPLAKVLGYGELIPTFKLARSPTQRVLFYTEVHGKFTITDVRNFIEGFGEDLAVDKIDNMLIKMLSERERGHMRTRPYSAGRLQM